MISRRAAKAQRKFNLATDKNQMHTDFLAAGDSPVVIRSSSVFIGLHQWHNSSLRLCAFA
jgi:hypothetical protein